MKTKINRIYLIFLSSITLLSGCSKNFLDTQQLGSIQEIAYYKTDADATSAIMAVYNMYKALNASIWTSDWMAKCALSDEIYTGGANAGDQPGYQQLNQYTFTPDNSFITNIYKYRYMIILRANLIIDNFGQLASPTTYQTQVIAEAKVLRALAYFDLCTLFGTPPLVLHELTTATYAQPNSTKELLWAQIEKDLNEAIAVLPAKSAQAAAGFDIARASKGFAQALLGKSLLFEGKNAEAVTVLQSLIDSQEYDLYTLSELGDSATDPRAYTQLFRKKTEFGKESVFEISYSNGRANDWSNAFGDLWNDPSRTNPSNTVWELCGPRGDEGFSGGSLGINGGWGFGYPTQELYQAYKDLGDSIRLHSNCITLGEITNAGGTLIATAQTVSGSDTIITQTNFPWGCPGFIRVKYTTWADETTPPVAELNYGTNLRVMRYADVLLLAAEAYLNNNDVTNATKYFNMVRTRVLLPALSTVTLNDIKIERRLELSFEGNRYQDLVRWGDAATVMGSQGLHIPTGVLTGTYLTGVRIKKSDGTNFIYVNYDLTKPLTNVIQNNTGAGFVAPKNNLFPIPQNEINSNPNMKQNPGY